MKIAYIAVLPEYSVGVANRIIDRAKAAQKNKFDFDFYYINPDREYRDKNIRFIKRSYVNNAFLNKLLFRMNTYSNIMKLIDLDKYDFIVLRYPLVDSYFGKFIKKFGHKVVTEHHTDEIAELFSGDRFVDKIRGVNEYLFSGMFLSKVKGIIGVTNEIVRTQLNKIENAKPNITVSNGIDIDSVTFTKFKPFDGKELNIIFVSSFFAPWHGLYKILEQLETYDGKVLINLNLIGGISEKDKIRIKNINSINKKVNINVKGKLYDKELDKLFNASTIAISTINISANKMTEACSLKTREYIARGIPFVYGYKDTDLRGDEKFALKIDEFDIKEIIEFAAKISSDKNISQDMRNFAKEKLDWNIKIQNIKEFLQKLK